MIKWVSPTLLTCDHVGICFNEKDFHRELKRLKVPPAQWSSWLTQDALATTHHLTSEKGSRASIVCIPIKPEMEGIDVATLLVHEAVHVLQEYLDYIGETSVGRETQAYAIQNISARLMIAYRDELFKRIEKDKKEWIGSSTLKLTSDASASPPSMQTETIQLSSNAPQDETTLPIYSVSSTPGARIKTG